MNVNKNNLPIYVHWTCLLKLIKDNINKNTVNKIKRKNIHGQIYLKYYFKIIIFSSKTKLLYKIKLKIKIKNLQKLITKQFKKKLNKKDLQNSWFK
jgi:hypothetical protein